MFCSGQEPKSDGRVETRTFADLETLRAGELVVEARDHCGHWGGARKAVDEYFASRRRPFLQYTDYTGRTGVELS